MIQSFKLKCKAQKAKCKAQIEHEKKLIRISCGADKKTLSLKLDKCQKLNEKCLKTKTSSTIPWVFVGFFAALALAGFIFGGLKK